ASRKVIEGGALGSPARWVWWNGRAGRRLARGTVRRFDLDQHRAAKGLPPTGVRGLLQDRSPPHICDASRARARRRAGMHKV
ncbi:MAG: hypothetical protein ACJ8B9_12055, partial [Microvirga sp.]